LRETTHHKTTRAFFELPLIVLQRIGDAGQVDQGGYGSVIIELDLQLHNLGLNSGCVRRIVQLVETGMRTAGRATEIIIIIIIMIMA